MKILHVITSLNIGGAEKLMVDLLPRFKEEGVAVDLLLFDGSNTPFKQCLLESGINIFEFDKGNFIYNPLNIFRLIPYLKKYDLIHTHNTAAQLFCALASIFRSSILITTEHNTSNRRRNWKWYRPIDCWMYNQYSKVICISDKTKQNLQSYLKYSYSNLVTIYNGIDTELFNQALPDKRIQTDYRDCCKLMMVAGFRLQKDQQTVIQAVSSLPEKFHLFLVGDGVERKKCETLCKSLNVFQRIHFLGIQTNIPQLLRAADIVILSSHWEGFGLAAVEGMAASKPVLATDIDGVREVVQDAGVLFAHGDAQQLATKIAKIASDAILYKEISNRCFTRSKMYDISKMVKLYKELYLSLSPKTIGLD